MWLCHSILLYKLVQKLIYVPRVSVLCWINLILISFGCSILLSYVEKMIYFLAVFIRNGNTYLSGGEK